MKKTLTLAEAKAIYGDTCFETETSFGVNKFGKYRPNMTFIIPKEFFIDKDGSPIDPISFVSDRDITDNMNIGWHGSAEVLFGDFWRSKKGGACFRPKDPRHARHLLIRVDWGGAFKSTRGVSSDYAEEVGATYFRSASSNGGGTGYDYWVLPVGFTRIIRDEEIDGDAPKVDRTVLFAQRAKAYREKHAKLQREIIEEADKFHREKAASEEESRKARAEQLSRVEALEARLNALREVGGYCIDSLTIGETYFELGDTEYLFTTDKVVEAEARVAYLDELVAKGEAEKAEFENSKAEFEPRYEALRSRIEKCGLTLEIRRSNWSSVGWIAKVDSNAYLMSEDEVAKLIAVIEKAERKQAEAAAKRLKEAAVAEAKASGLPSNVRIWHRSGATNAGQGWVISPNGMDRDYDEIENPRPRYQSEGYAIWRQIMPGEVVLRWAHASTAAEHEFEVLFRPEELTDAQLERVFEIEQELESTHFGQVSATRKYTCPSIGEGWGLY